MGTNTLLSLTSRKSFIHLRGLCGRGQGLVTFPQIFTLNNLIDVTLEWFSCFFLSLLDFLAFAYIPMWDFFLRKYRRNAFQLEVQETLKSRLIVISSRKCNPNISSRMENNSGEGQSSRKSLR